MKKRGCGGVYGLTLVIGICEIGRISVDFAVEIVLYRNGNAQFRAHSAVLRFVQMACKLLTGKDLYRHVSGIFCTEMKQAPLPIESGFAQL
jgi:hypothetical protein